MPNQVLKIEPQSELKFKGLFEQGNTTYMRLMNPTENTVLFKIKTTAPKKYCVRPNSGVLDPYSKTEIAITPQPVYVDSNEKHKHKFMVQSIIAPEGKTNIDQIWKEITPDQIIDYKLKCVFLTPRGTSLNDSGDNPAQNEQTKKRLTASDTKVQSAAQDADEVEAKKSDDHASLPPLSAQTMFGKSDNDSDIQKASTEVTRLREEESKLRQENLQLKDEVLRLRQQAGAGRHAYSPAPGLERVATLPWLATAISMALIGIIIGKFIM